MPYRLALFDFDGTLADSFPCFLRALNEAAARFGFQAVDARDLERLRGLSAWQVMEHIDVAMWQVPMITQFMRARMRDAIDSVSLFPGIHEVLEDLARRDVQLTIVSSNARASIEHVLGARLASLIGDYRCDVSIFGKRPKLRQALAASRCVAQDAIAIGDELRDLRAARGEGIAFGAVTWGFTSVPALVAAAPEHVLQHVDDIVHVVSGAVSLRAEPGWPRVPGVPEAPSPP